MNTILWVMQVLLAVFFILPGYGKIANTKQEHIDNGHLKPEASILPIRVLGVLEWFGCVGIIVPWYFEILPVLTPLAALGFCFIMIAGLVNHILKKEYKMLPMLSIVLILAAIVAYYRFLQLV